MSREMIKQELTELIQAERSRIEGLITGLTEDQVEKPGVQKDWAIKDILFHLTVWEQRGINWIRAIARRDDPKTPSLGYSWRDQPKLNEKLIGKIKIDLG